jgi:hypothetical protein
MAKQVLTKVLLSILLLCTKNKLPLNILGSLNLRQKIMNVLNYAN